MSFPKFSIIIPVYNRPQEIDELLVSLTLQSIKDFEVIVVEDGSSISCEFIIEKYRDRLNLQYFFKKNSGPGPSRNFGYERARGKYFIVFDSDCIIPQNYFEAVERALTEFSWDAWGGPDKAHENFTPIQRAMGYTMSSVLTTGGIRGAKKSVGQFQPRSFNMGISKEVFEITHGFAFDRFAEDIEFSIRMKELGFKVGLVPDAFVFHKRRTDFLQFFKQVFNFGKGRVLVGNMHPGEIKVTHWFPAFFTIGTGCLILTPLINQSLASLSWTAFAVYLFMIFAHSFLINKSMIVALLSVPSALLQLWGYGLGFMREWIKSYVNKITFK
jgi:glycosyltransferase involved in cell wall biosynthesis